MKALDLYIKYQDWADEYNHPQIGYNRFCEMKMFFESLNTAPTGDKSDE